MSPITSAIVDTFNLFYNVFSRNEKILSIMKIVVNNKDIFLKYYLMQEKNLEKWFQKNLIKR